MSQTNANTSADLATTPPNASATARAPHVIDQRQNPDKPYRIITDDELIIPRSAAQLAHASRNQVSAEVWASNFHKMADHLRGWCDKNSDRIEVVLVEFCSDKVVFFVIPTSLQFDYELIDQQSQLDIYLNTRGNIGYVETRQIPKWDAEAFVSAEARVIWFNKSLSELANAPQA